jgi:hypothetical protein
VAERERVASPLRPAGSRAAVPATSAKPAALAVALPLRELTGWEEEFLERRQYDENTARTCNEVLARCCGSPGHEPDPALLARVRGLLVAERDRELVRLRRMSLGAEVETRVDCPACGGTNEATFSLDQLDVDLALPDRRDGIEIGDDELTLTLPTAGDQEDLLDAGVESAAERRTWLLGRCLREGDGSPIGVDAARALPVRRRAELENAIDERVPALDLEMAVRCVHCTAEFAAPFDVGVFFFRPDGAARRPAPRRAPSGAGLPLVGAADLGPAGPPTPGVPRAAGGRRGRRAARGTDRPGVRRADLTPASASR